MKKTNNENNYLRSGNIYLIIWLFLFIFGLIFFFFINKIFDSIDVSLNFKIFFMIFLIFDLVIMSVILLIPAFKIYYGWFKGKIKLKNNSKINNPYLYYRNLPNNYGIGVSSLLIDSSIENEKDIVATILDLCARKYLKLEKKENNYELTMLNKNDNNLLTNEKYILDCITKNKLKEINYQYWYNLCLKDGISLGLYKDNIKIISRLNNIYQEIEIKEEKWDGIINKLSTIFFFISLLVSFISYSKNNDLFNSLIIFSLFFFGSMMILVVILMLKRMNMIGKEFENESYKHALNTEVKKTKKGLEEVYKLEAFKDFIKDFGNFAHRNLEEIVLWDRYLSYAQLFGLTKEILATGYTKLITNNSFKIDNINNITLDSLQII